MTEEGCSIFLIVLVLLVMLCCLGCVSIKTHEDGVATAFHEGKIYMLKKSIEIVEESYDKKHAARQLRMILLAL